MTFNGRARGACVRAHEHLMSAPRSTVLAAAFVASVLVVALCVYGVLSSRHAVTVADSAAGSGEGRVVVSWGRTVGDLLADGGVPVGDCDQVTPSVDAPLAGVDKVNVVRCRSALIHDGAGGVVAVGRALVESVRVPLPLLVAHYRGQAKRDRAALTSGLGDVGRRVKLARNVTRQEARADSLTERGVLPIVSWERMMDGVRSLAAGGVVGADVLPVVEPMAGTGFVS